MGHGCHDCGSPNSCECPGTFGAEMKQLREAREREHARGIVSEPGSAWDIISQDRDTWKSRALLAEAKVAKLLGQLYLLNASIGIDKPI